MTAATPNMANRPQASRALDFCCLAALSVSVFLLGYHEIWDRDIFFHLANGRALLEHGVPLRENVFVWPPSSLPFYQNPAWLFGVGVAWLYNLGGLTAVILVKCLVLVALFAILFKILREQGAPPPAAALLPFIVAMASALRFNERPEMFTFLFFGLFVWLVQRFRQGIDRVLWLFPLLMVPWANLHSGCIFGLIYLGLCWAGAALRRLSGAGPACLGEVEIKGPRLARLAMAVAATGGAMFLTPDPTGNLRFLFQHLHVTDVVPVAEYGFPTPALVPWFYVLLAVLLLLSFVQRRWAPVALLPMLAFLLLAFSGVRFVPLFGVAALPAVAPGLTRLSATTLPRLTGTARRIVGGGLNVIGPLLLVATVLLVPPVPGRHIVVVNPTMTPLAAFDFLDRADARGRLYNSMSYGAAGMFHLYPKYRLFQTSYIQVEEDRMAEAYRSSQSPEMWRDFLRRYDIQVALIDTRMESPLPAYFPEQEWALVFFDDVSAVFLRRGGENQGLIDRHAYRVVQPFTFSQGAGMINIDLNRLDAGIEELRRALEQNPESSLVHLLLGYYLSLQGGRDEEALQHFLEVTRIKPEMSAAYYQQGILYRDLGQPERAAAALKTYIQGIPTDPQGYLQLAQCYLQLAREDAALQVLEQGVEKVAAREELLHLLGNLYQGRQDFEKAQELYLQALAITPRESILLNDYGVALGSQGKLEEALKAFDAALSNRPDYADAARNRAYTLSLIEQRNRNGGKQGL